MQRVLARVVVVASVAIAAVVATASVGGCGGGPAASTTPAATGVRSLVVALRADDARAAYALLSVDARKQISFDEFALQWKASTAERAWQAKALEDSLRGDPDVGERAVVAYPDGKLVQLEREGATWRLESALVSRSRARRPRDAVRIFSEALGRNDLDGVLHILTARRRDGLAKQIEAFVTGLDQHVDGKIDEIGTDRAELRWDEGGVRYRVILRREDDEWRIDDLHIRPAPEDDEDDDATETPVEVD